MLRPRTIEELSEAVGKATSLDIVGLDSKRSLRRAIAAGATLSVRGLSGIVEWSREDQVATVYAGTSLDELQDELSVAGQCLPTSATGTLGGEIAMNPRQGGRGPWSDWLLGATFVLADGTIAKAGSRVVKSVAGYDAHKLAIGSRGSFLILATVTLRTVAGVRPEPSHGRAMDFADANIELDPTQARFMRRAKYIFDPSGKLNPGEWGDF